MTIKEQPCKLCGTLIQGMLGPNDTVVYSCRCFYRIFVPVITNEQAKESKTQLQELLEFREGIHKKSLDLVVSKGHDYNRTQQENGDTLFNLKVAALLGIVDLPERGILVRLTDKLMRLISLLDAKERHESFEDTVVDIHNYVDYLAFLRKKRLNGN